MENSGSDIDYRLKNRLIGRFPLGMFLVTETNPGEIDRILTMQLVEPFEQTSRHGLWGNDALRISMTGRWLGWVPSRMVVLFFADTVLQEIANGIASKEKKTVGRREEQDEAVQLLKELDISHLAQRNPYTLSQGESKLVWFLTQWAKKPEYLIVSDLKAGLSERLRDRVVAFIMRQMRSMPKTPIIIFNVLENENVWARNLENQGWQWVEGFLGEK